MALFIVNIFGYQRIMTEIVLVAIPAFYFIGLIARWIWYHSPLKELHKWCRYLFRRIWEHLLTSGALFDIAENRKKNEYHDKTMEQSFPIY